MSYDIYGNNLRRGHCEVHPHVHEEYPCSLCFMENERHRQQKEAEDEQRRYYESQEQEYYERQHIKHLYGLPLV